MKNTLSYSPGQKPASAFSVSRLAQILSLAIIFLMTSTASQAAISGAFSVCVGSNTPLTDTPPGGTWTSSNLAIATVGSSSGIVHGVAAGIVKIYYAAGSTLDSVNITVNANPAPIVGPTILFGGPIHVPATLTDATPGGFWSSGFAGVAVVGSASGVVTAISCGTVTLSYTSLTTGCIATQLDTVLCGPPTVLVYYGISGAATPICVGSTATFTDSAAGGHWFSSNPSVATVGSTSGVVAGVSAGTCSILYAVGSLYAAATITVNPAPTAHSVSGGGTFCAGGSGLHVGLGSSSIGVSYQLLNGATAVGSPLAGTGSPLDFGTQAAAGTYTVIATNNTTSCSNNMTGSATIVVNPAPAPFCGPTAACVGTTFSACNPTSGGTWSSSTTSVATINSTSGLVTGVATGASTITYTLGTGCFITETVNITGAPCALPSLAPVCVGTSATLTNCTSGGTWTSSSTSTASIGSLSGTVSGLAIGTTDITYSLGTGCTVSATLTVTGTPAAITGPSSACVGSTISLSDLTASGVWSSSATSVATVSVSGIVTGIASGTTTISYTIGGCSATKVITVNPNPSPIGGPSTTCASGTITLTNTLSGGIFTSSSTAVATIDSFTGILSALTPGTTLITYSFAGCQATKTVTVGIATPIVGPLNICTGTATLLANLTLGGIWTSSNTSVAAIGSSTGAVNAIAPGTSTISYTLPSGCSVTALMSVSAYPGPISGPATVCNNSCTTYSAGLPGGSWSVTPTTVASVGSSTGTVCGVYPGTATIYYSLSGGCYVSYPITINPAPAAIGGPTSVCQGSTITLTNTVGGGTWSTTTTTIATVAPTSGVVTGIGSGTAIITYTHPSGCMVLAPVIVHPTAPVTGPSTVCAGQTISLTNVVVGGSWFTSAPAIATVAGGVVTGVAAGSAIITYYMPGGCIATKSVTVFALPSAITGPHAVCAGSVITLADAMPGGTWFSSNTSIATISSLGTLTGVIPGVDTISYTIGTGCSATFTVTVNTLPPAITGITSVCLGGTSTLYNTTPFGTWVSGAPAIAAIGSSTGVVNALAGGTATITYTLPTGCAVTTAFTVLLPPPAITGATSLCASHATTLFNASPGGTWSNTLPLVGTIDPVTGVFSGFSSGVSTVTYTLASGCYNTRTITVNPLPGLISGSTLLCPGTTVTLTNPTPSGLWTSSNPSVANINAFTGVVTGVSNGFATIYYTLPTGCYVTVTLYVSPAPSSIAGTATLCQGLTTTLFDATPGGSWVSSTPAIATVSSGGVVTGINTGTALISYISSLGCITTRTVTVNLPPAPVMGSSSVCSGAAIALIDTVLGGTWSSSNAAIASVGATSGIVTGNATGTVTIVYTMGASCYAFKSITVDPVPSPITGPPGVCTGTSITLSSGTPGGSWTSSYPTIASVGVASGTVTGLIAGITTISYTLGCSATYNVTVNPSPTAITGTLHTCVGGTTTLTDTITGGFWTSSASSVASITFYSGILSGLSIGTTTISYTLPGGCTTSALATIYAPPSVYTITGGGNYCAGGSGVHVGLSGSEVGINYLLYLGTSPTGTFPGTGSPLDFGLQTVAGIYTVRAMGTLSECTANMLGSVSIAIIPTVTPSVSMTSAPGDTVCSGTLVTYTSIPVNGGSTPVYRWLINGIFVATGPTYTYLPVAGDIITVKLASSAACPVPDTVMAIKTPTVHPSGNPLVSIVAIPGDTVCKGSLISFTATPTLGGASPAYTWFKNGIGVGSGIAYSYIGVAGDNIYCVITSNDPCRLSNTASSNHKIVVVDTPVYPTVTITAAPSSIVHPGDTVTFTASVINGGISPSFQWYLNGNPIPGATNYFYVIDSFSTPQSDSISCRVTSSGPCVLTTKQSINVIVAPVGISQLHYDPVINVAPNPNKGTFSITASAVDIADKTMTLEITNMLGQSVHRELLDISSGKINHTIKSDSKLASGLYILSIKSEIISKSFHLIIEQ